MSPTLVSDSVMEGRKLWAVSHNGTLKTPISVLDLVSMVSEGFQAGVVVRIGDQC
jgi:hypothetical protein